MSGIKLTISSPLEAGPPLFDTHVPAPIAKALEYVSSRLASRGQHATLLMVRRDCQLPPSLVRPTSLPPPTPSSPNPARFLRRQFSDLTSRASPNSPSGGSSRFLWPGRRSATPSRDEIMASPTPITPASSWSVSTDQSDRCASPATPWTPHSPGSTFARFLVSPSQDLDADLFADLVRKTERKFHVRIDAVVCSGMASNLIFRNSIEQARASTTARSQSLLFSSEAVTVLSLDWLYSFKATLASHSRTPTPFSLRDTTDELHRLIVSRGTRKVARADVLRSYDWLPAPSYALAEVEREYRRVYGGSGSGPFSGGSFAERVEEAREDVIHTTEHTIGARTAQPAAWEEARNLHTIEHTIEARTAQLEAWSEPGVEMMNDKENDRPPTPIDDEYEDGMDLERIETPVISTATIVKRPLLPPRLRSLKIQTNVPPMPAAPLVPRRNPLRSKEGRRRGGMVIDTFGGVGGDGNRSSSGFVIGLGLGLGIGLGMSSANGYAPNTMSVGPARTESIMSKVSDMSYVRPGPMTPNAYGDITPITRGEWGRLVSDGVPRTAAVETF